MKKKNLSILFTVLCITGCNAQYEITTDFIFKDDNVKIIDSLESTNNEKTHIVFLYGQSNADGASSIEYLRKKDQSKFEEYSVGYENVFINFINDGGNTSSNYTFQKCTLGCGYNSDCFGPENGIADEMHKAFPNEKTFIIKWTWGGTVLRNQWLDNHHHRGELYNSAMDFSLKCLDYLLSKGYQLSLDGICWMQGESDSFDANKEAYYRDTISLVSAFRLDFAKYQKEIKFIDAAINDQKGTWQHPEVVNNGKKRFAEESDLNHFIDTNKLGIVTSTEPEENIDYAHYDSLSMVKLGQEFGKIAANN